MRLLVPVCTVVTLAVIGTGAARTAHQFSIQPRPADPLLLSPNAAVAGAPARQPFSLRLVDAGGVGIPLEAWGGDYSHDRRIFRDAIREAPPYLDAAAFEDVESEWRFYVDRMLEYGNNVIAVPLFLELIDFDRTSSSDSGSGSAPIYDSESPFRARHAAVRSGFGALFEWTSGRGMRVFLDTDMLTLTPPLASRLRALAPAANAVGIDTSSPKVWQVYRAGLEELFDTLPAVEGVVIRFGEGGALYNTDGWPYRSEMAVRDAVSLRAMLRELLPLFEQRNKTLVLRSWTVGLGNQLGRLHIDPRVYETVLGEIDSPALVVSTKFTAGDFFSYLPLNPTLASGRHRRIVELQAKPEFEGFGAFPDFLGEEHARALRTLSSLNPNIVGTYVFSQYGGPLRAGPRMLYPFHGFWLWTDANVFVASHLASDPAADVKELARQWAAARFGGDPQLVDAVADVLTETREAVLKGFYIRPFAEHVVRIPGYELPPLMWIFEWDMVGGWNSLLSVVYRGSQGRVDEAIDEGYQAAATVRRARERLQSVFSSECADSRAELCRQTLRSLEYQETLFDVLAAWRQAFLSYYRWLDTGDRDAWSGWQAGRTRFTTAAAEHRRRFAHDLEFPAFDLESAENAVRGADRARWARYLALVVLICVTTLLVLGSPFGKRRIPLPAGGWLSGVTELTWTSAVTPWRVGRQHVDFGAAVTAAVLALTLITLLIGTLTGFAAMSIIVSTPLVIGLVATVFEGTATGVARREDRGRNLVACAGPTIPGIALLFVAIMYFGPVGFWFAFWTEPYFRVPVVAILMALPCWIALGILGSPSRGERRRNFGSALAAAGAGLVVLTMLLPDSMHALRFLDRPLNIAPTTTTMLFALRTYVGLNFNIAGWSWIAGALLFAAGQLLVRYSFHLKRNPLILLNL